MPQPNERERDICRTAAAMILNALTGNCGNDCDGPMIMRRDGDPTFGEHVAHELSHLVALQSEALHGGRRDDAIEHHRNLVHMLAVDH